MKAKPPSEISLSRILAGTQRWRTKEGLEPLHGGWVERSWNVAVSPRTRSPAGFGGGGVFPKAPGGGGPPLSNGLTPIAAAPGRITGAAVSARAKRPKSRTWPAKPLANERPTPLANNGAAVAPERFRRPSERTWLHATNPRFDALPPRAWRCLAIELPFALRLLRQRLGRPSTDASSFDRTSLSHKPQER